jgi:predicted PP-loop superfamily ATPase
MPAHIKITKDDLDKILEKAKERQSVHWGCTQLGYKYAGVIKRARIMNHPLMELLRPYRTIENPKIKLPRK